MDHRRIAKVPRRLSRVEGGERRPAIGEPEVRSVARKDRKNAVVAGLQ